MLSSGVPPAADPAGLNAAFLRSELASAEFAAGAMLAMASGPFRMAAAASAVGLAPEAARPLWTKPLATFSVSREAKLTVFSGEGLAPNAHAAVSATATSAAARPGPPAACCRKVARHRGRSRKTPCRNGTPSQASGSAPTADGSALYGSRTACGTGRRRPKPERRCVLDPRRRRRGENGNGRTSVCSAGSRSRRGIQACITAIHPPYEPKSVSASPRSLSS